MFGKILSLLASVTLCMGCTSNPPEIRAICLRDDIGNYILKWETDPPVKGVVKMYVSDTPDGFNKSNPALYAPIDEGVATYITNDNITRKYFELVFNNRYPKIVGARWVATDSIQNLRDMGGYTTRSGKRATRWGKIFRSGQPASLSERDSIRLDNLGVKTIIDLRTDSEIVAAPIRYNKAKIVHISVSTGRMKEIPDRIREGRMRKGDAILYMQDQYLQFVTDNSEAFARALEEFQHPENYPILFNCSFGKDRTGFMAALLLSALDIPEETIMKDYVASNDYIDLSHLAYLARNLDTDAQESITVLLTANESLMDLTFRKIRKDYGSVDKFLSKKLNLTEKKRTRLKDMLLY